MELKTIGTDSVCLLLVAGGLAGTTGWFHTSAKTYRAPTERERQLKRDSRILHEQEERKMKDIKQGAKMLQDQRELENRLLRVNNMAQRAEGAAIVDRLRGRSRSFSGYGGGGLYGGGLGGSSGLAQIQAERNMARERERLAATERERLRNELERSRLQRARVQEEAMRRQRTLSSLEQERRAIAAGNAAIFNNRINGQAQYGRSPGLGAGLNAPMLQRRASFSSVPLRPVIHVSPGLGGRLPSPRMGGSPMLRPQAAPIVNYNTYNVSPGRPNIGINPNMNRGISGAYGLSPRGPIMPSPRMSPGGSPYIGPAGGFSRSAHASPVIMGGLGALDDLSGGGMGYRVPSPRMSPYTAPVVADGGQMYGPSLFGGAQASPMMMNSGPPVDVEFPITDAAYPEQGSIVNYLGEVQGYAPIGSSDDLLNAAMSDMIIKARSMGANGVVSMTFSEAGDGGLVASGQAVQIG